ncbi:hypothetical protein BKA65DRAFT_513889, partial [Rhexocercosporidium sp. MPI-PUGE-AT-0058]
MGNIDSDGLFISTSLSWVGGGMFVCCHVTICCFAFRRRKRLSRYTSYPCLLPLCHETYNFDVVKESRCSISFCFNLFCFLRLLALFGTVTVPWRLAPVPGPL